MADTDQWVVLELGPKADGEDPDLVRASIRHSIRDAEVFIPASVTKMGEDRVIQYLVEGYAFIKRTHPDATYMRLENTKYVQSVLRHPISQNGGKPIKHLATVAESQIETFRSQIRVEVDQGIAVGDLVMITSGPYRQITARVEEEIPERDAVQVYIRLRSKEAIITLPRACLRLVQKAQRSPLRERVDAVRGWLQGAHAAMSWPKDAFTHVLLPYETFMRLSDWLIRGQQRVRFITSFNTELDLGPVQQRYKKYHQLATWVGQGKLLYGGILGMTAPLPPLEPLLERVREWNRVSTWLQQGKKLYGVLNSAYNPPPSPTLDARYLDWLWFNDVYDRLDAVHSSLDGIELSLRVGGKAGMVQNLIIDGTQLALRCAMAPGLGELKDSKERPTGAILGFCQSLGSLKKRYPKADFYVTWDGSNQRRRKMFAGYKKSRGERSPMATFEIQFLKGLLSKLGVHQAYNPEEEADDVIATLVRKKLKGQLNAILSTDRDLLQLVTSTDQQLVPAVGAGKEKLYTVEAVTQEYGVGPDQITQVRALMGDSSDEIPGADGFGLKTSSKLVKVYGSVHQLFTSNFAGLTQKQYGSLRAAEDQIKLNLDLLRLQDDLVLTLVGPDPDQIAASERLREVELKPDHILAAFFGKAPGVSAHV
jgi:5'-3' exonuclease/transcription antitermination factor NusG